MHPPRLTEAKNYSNRNEDFYLGMDTREPVSKTEILHGSGRSKEQKAFDDK